VVFEEFERKVRLALLPIVNAGLVGGEEVVGGAVDGDGLDEVTSFDGVDDVLSFGGLAKDGVFSVEVGSGKVGDEELGAVGVGSGVGHGEDAGLVVPTVGLALALEFVAGAAGAGAGRAAALDHEVGDHAVERQAVVEPARGEVEE